MPHAHDPAYAARMAAAADALLESLDDDQRNEARQDFDDDRHDWHYVPRRHPGLALARLDANQRSGVHQLLAACLSEHAYGQVAVIMALEDVLDVQEGARRGRHNLDYALTVFGEPGSDRWGWRFEGHHVAINVTVVGASVSATPLFLGANPSRIAHGHADTVRPLAEEETVARALAVAAPGAVVSDRAPSDILTRNQPRVGPGEPAGVRLSELGGEPAALLRQLTSVYRARVRIAGEQPDGELFFAWSGSTEPGRPHYYQLSGPDLLVEYDNTQNGANHIHTVWRSPAGDFGEDLLARHYQNAH